MKMLEFYEHLHRVVIHLDKLVEIRDRIGPDSDAVALVEWLIEDTLDIADAIGHDIKAVDVNPHSSE